MKNSHFCPSKRLQSVHFTCTIFKPVELWWSDNKDAFCLRIAAPFILKGAFFVIEFTTPLFLSVSQQPKHLPRQPQVWIHAVERQMAAFSGHLYFYYSL